MEQPMGAVTFREVDQHGNRIPDGGAGEPPEPGEKSPGFSVNPFIVVLWLLAAALVVGGLAVLFGGAGTTVMSFGSTNGPPLAYLLMSFSPQLIVSGLATAMVLLFWHAFQWQRRRG
ncbi:hypothetical protein [Arthrobacter sp. Leaf141]|uniref:hypothetical protein n=1 Tax=Arthrobacter sp. Leaf141 TaxID=1736273 RepID=UPI000A7D9034|nr:hypothetical protein [Arthrobacter sp. Leaf141]